MIMVMTKLGHYFQVLKLYLHEAWSGNKYGCGAGTQLFKNVSKYKQLGSESGNAILKHDLKWEWHHIRRILELSLK